VRRTSSWGAPRAAGVMEAEDLELAAEFCKLVGVPNLLAYLGLDESADPADARARLKTRRKFMQGMQGNPKYKREALFLIKHFTNLNDALADVRAYMADAQRRAESIHLPVIEMTIRGVLASGSLNTDQEDYLRRNATELGVSERTFREVLYRVGREVGISVPTPAPPPTLDGALDLYGLLGVTRGATDDEITLAWQRKSAELENASQHEASALRARLDLARKVLSHEVARRAYDGAAARTGPPARTRQQRPDLSATAPPVRERYPEPAPDVADGDPPPAEITRLEIEGDPVRRIKLGRGITVATIAIRNGGDGRMGGTITGNEPWLGIHPTRLDPALREQEIEVQIDRADVPHQVSAAVVTIETDRGERARVVFEIHKGTPAWTVIALVAAALLLVGIGSGLLMSLL